MGTSASSKGPGKDVPLVPPWVQPVEPIQDDGDEGENDHPEGEAGEQEEENAPSHEAQVLAPARRFAGARAGLGRFATSGSSADLASGLGHYVSSGLGGSGTGTARFGGTARIAGQLYGGLSGFSGGEARPAELGIDRASLAGKPAREVGDKIIEAVCPNDGTQDTEARRDSLARSISELTEQFPDADLTALTPEQIDLLMQGFIANDLCHRIELDIGKAIFTKAPDSATAVRRVDEMRQYVKEKVSAAFRARAERGEKFTRTEASRMAATVIKDTLSVFEDYVK